MEEKITRSHNQQNTKKLNQNFRIYVKNETNNGTKERAQVRKVLNRNPLQTSQNHISNTAQNAKQPQKPIQERPFMPKMQ